MARKIKSDFQIQLEKCNYPTLNPFLVPFYFVIELADVFEQGIYHEDLIMNYYFSRRYHPYQTILTTDAVELIKNIEDEEKKYLKEHLKSFKSPYINYLFSFILDQNTSVMEEDFPQSITLQDWYLMMIKELFADVMLDISADIAKMLETDNIHLFKAFFNSGDISLDLLTYQKETLVHGAVKSEAKRILTFLIRNGANINQADYFGNTPMHTACARGYIDGYRLLKEENASLSVANLDHMLPYDIALYSQNIEFIDYLLEEEMVSSKDLIYYDAICIYVQDNVLGGLYHLIEKNLFDVNTILSNDETLFDLACKYHNQELAEYLLNHQSFDYTRIDSRGYHLVHKVSQYDFIDFVPQLILKGIELMIETEDGWNHLEVCTIHHSDLLFQYYIKNGLDYKDHLQNIISIASKEVNLTVLRFLRDEKVNLNILLGPKATPYLYLLQKFSKENIMEFIDDIDIDFHNQNEVPLLIDPTFHNDSHVTRELLKRGASPNLAVHYTTNTFYPIMNAIYHQNLEIVKLLCEYHADVNVKTKSHLKPLNYAKNPGRRNPEMVAYLVSQGAKSSYFLMILIISIASIIGIAIIVLLLLFLI